MTTEKDNNSNFKDTATELADKCTQDGKFAMANQYSTTICTLRLMLGKTKFDKLTIGDINEAFCLIVICHGKEKIKRKNVTNQRWSDTTIKQHLKIIRAVVNHVYKQTKDLRSSKPFNAAYDPVKHVKPIQINNSESVEDIAKVLKYTGKVKVNAQDLIKEVTGKKIIIDSTNENLSKALGHNDLTTTNTYLEAFDEEEKS